MPVVGGCQIFPKPAASPSGNSWWNVDVSHYPLDSNSSKYIAKIDSLGATFLHPDFGHQSYYGIPFNVVPSTQKMVPVSFGYKGQSDPGPYPIPPDAQIEGGANSKGDRHVLVLQQATCKL